MAVRSIADFRPERVVKVPDLPELAELTDAERQACLALGIERVHADPDHDAVDLAAGAARKLLAETGASPGALLVIGSRAPGRLMSSEATRLQELLGLPDALTFSVGGLGCVSITPALLTARGLLAADPGLGEVLVVHGSKPPTPRRYRHPVTVSGDGGQAVLLARTGPVRVLDIAQATNGAYWDLYTVDFRDRPTADWREECADTRRYSFTLAMEGRARLRELYRELLARNGMTTGDVTCHLSQNLSAGAFRFTEEALGVRLAAACAGNLAVNGHLGPNDVLFNLSGAIAGGELPPGSRAVVFNASPVAAWSLLLVEHAGGEAETHYL
ncbi:3-oxoacyl-ACP synthase [Amycolatopsis sp. 195334CR]|nr:3-oxoacyl-ACP synthase [Amycolatopsis sp. 195334CR]